MISKEKLLAGFAQKYGDVANVHTFFAPGRVNLIGEHIDYNGGNVFPAALTIGIGMAIRKTDSGFIEFGSATHEDTYKIAHDDLDFDDAHDWANYPKGIINELNQQGHKFGGLQLYFVSDLPDGAGLSSSAAIEVVTGFGLYRLAGVAVDKIDRKALALLCQKVENEYIGVNCGIMDQFAICFGKANSAILLDCATLEYSYATIHESDKKLLVIDTNKKRELSESKYNERRAECEAALQIINDGAGADYENICQIGLETAKQYLEKQHPILWDRALHVISENERVGLAMQALKTNDWESFGHCLNQSHESLKNLYQVTGPELDALSEAARNQSGCVGARMTGAGFGGCVIAFVQQDKIKSFIAQTEKIYTEKTGLKAGFYVSDLGQGVSDY